MEFPPARARREEVPHALQGVRASGSALRFTDLLYSPGLGDAWGQPSRAGPLDSVAKELGSHLLQVKPLLLGEGAQPPPEALIRAGWGPPSDSALPVSSSFPKDPRVDPEATIRLQKSSRRELLDLEAIGYLPTLCPCMLFGGRDWSGLSPTRVTSGQPHPDPASHRVPALVLSSSGDLDLRNPVGAPFFPTLLPSANFHGALALCQTLCQALEPKKK